MDQQSEKAIRNWYVVAVVILVVNGLLFILDVNMKKQILDAIREGQELAERLGVYNGFQAPTTVPGRVVAPTHLDPPVEYPNGGTPMVDALSSMEETAPPNEAGKGRAQFTGTGEGIDRPRDSRGRFVRP